MKFKTSAKAFQHGLQMVEAAVPVRTPLPAATCVKITLAAGFATLTATDTACLIRYTFPVEAAEDGVALVSARKLLNFVKTLKTEELQATLLRSEPEGHETLSLTTGSIELDLPVLPAGDFPEAPPESGVSFKVAQADLRRALKMTVFAAAVDDSRFVLNGCFLHFLEGEWRVVATDSRRLSLAVFTPTTVPAEPEKAQFIIPSHVVRMLLAHLEYEPEVTCTLGPKRASFQFETQERQSYYLHFSLIEGQYPNYHRYILPLERRHKVSREAFLQALRRAGSAIEDKEGCINLRLEGDQLEVRAKSNCNFQETLKMDYAGEPITTVFSPRYLAEALEETPEADLTFDMAGPQSPLVFKGNNYLHVTMPRRI